MNCEPYLSERNVSPMSRRSRPISRGLPVSRETQVLDLSPDDLPPAEELREDVQGALNGWVALAYGVVADVLLNEPKLENVVQSRLQFVTGGKKRLTVSVQGLLRVTPRLKRWGPEHGHDGADD
jgi:hypothetical protein